MVKFRIGSGLCAISALCSLLGLTSPASATPSNNIYFWNGSSFVVAPGDSCATSIGVGPNSRGLTNGTPWTVGCETNSDGNHAVWQMQTGETWVKMQHDVATQITVSPSGVAWAINATGEIFYWNGSTFVLGGPSGGCATSIAVGTAYGVDDPWVTGCDHPGGNHNVYELQGFTGRGDGGTWALAEANVAAKVGVAGSLVYGGVDYPYALTDDYTGNNVLYWDGATFFNDVPGCGRTIAGDPGLLVWTTGCNAGANGNYSVYQLESTSSYGFNLMESDIATQIAVSPDFGIPWIINTL